MLVKDYLYKDITSVSETTTIARLIKIMSLNRASCMPIVNNNNEFLGIITEGHLIKSCLPDYLKYINNTAVLPDINKLAENLQKILDQPVQKFIQKDLPVLRPEDSVSYAADLMNKLSLRTLPVVDKKRLLGTISRLDILHVLLKNKENGCN